ncbi:Universal stress protein/MSMEI_3859 [Mycolicibacterium vanbaalenii]|uniref:Universal stress protein/MSMEI_3859 n=1 Tax=Mycolicibacterium vanbaalenii TaxID=110539 RepID=A0A5S9R3X0_MYCVN|nr:universal stress protein [Mycolicibacterium vanbaalenii]CAA0127058.1 Universal stress protein/MSMEI_3859 [Mycolicibacterium vanbaalenii]
MAVRVVMGYDGSQESGTAIDVGVSLFPGAHGWITYLWVPPFASEKVRQRLRSRARDTDELVALVEQEGEREAQRVVTTGVTLAGAAGWDAEPLLKRTWGGEGWRIAQVAEEVDADLVIVGSRGLGGAKAFLGSVSDLVVHYCARPMVVVPHPMLSTEHEALAGGPVIVGWDGSAGAEKALEAAMRLLPDRDLLLVSVDNDDPVDEPASVDAEVLGSRKVERLRVERGHGFPAHACADALISAARDHDAAVIVVGSRGRSAARKILLGSVAMATLHNAERPVMVVPSEWEVP